MVLKTHAKPNENEPNLDFNDLIINAYNALKITDLALLYFGLYCCSIRN